MAPTGVTASVLASRHGFLPSAKHPQPRTRRCDEHVGHTVQPPSAQAVQELVDSFSDQKLDATKTKSMHGGIEEQAKNDTIFSPKQVGLCRSYMEMLTDEEEDVVSYRRFWEYTWGGKCSSFEDYTFLTPTLYTYGTIPAHAGPFSFLQIFSIKVMENEIWRIRWPVEVYGFIAARDNLDRNRNLLFSQTRDDPQILTQQIQLKVKGTAECEDETLMARAFEYGYGFGEYGELACRRWAGNFCTLEITSALLSRTVAATIISADVIKGSWPGDYRGRVVARTANICFLSYYL
uniref:DUF6598 domain-containing protein n=1 Tax=Aegilops tauschii TaxID=37682 RepID=N1QW43_AEGTA